jgi:hypothetical protein
VPATNVTKLNALRRLTMRAHAEITYLVLDLLLPADAVAKSTPRSAGTALLWRQLSPAQ